MIEIILKNSSDTSKKSVDFQLLRKVITKKLLGQQHNAKASLQVVFR